MKTCPYCKIDFSKDKWAAASQPRIICLNCRWYYEAMIKQNEYEKELKEAKELANK